VVKEGESLLSEREGRASVRVCACMHKIRACKRAHA
jgi:hypothetical protein